MTTPTRNSDRERPRPKLFYQPPSRQQFSNRPQHQHQQTIEQLRPIQLTGGEVSLSPVKKILVFPGERQRTVLALVGGQGSLNVSLSRRSVAALVAALTNQLAHEVQPVQAATP